MPKAPAGRSATCWSSGTEGSPSSPRPPWGHRAPCTAVSWKRLPQAASPPTRDSPSDALRAPTGARGPLQAILARDPGCRAFLCASDETAAGVMSGLRDAGLPTGVDTAVIGYGNTKLAGALRLTSIDPGFERLAERVVVSAVEGMNSGAFPEEVFLITPELAVRDSCAPPR